MAIAAGDHICPEDIFGRRWPALIVLLLIDVLARTVVSIEEVRVHVGF
jgi:hypothetical protein